MSVIFDIAAQWKNRSFGQMATSDVTGKLVMILAKKGRGRVASIATKLLIELFGLDTDVDDLTDCYLSLLKGDLQIKRATGAVGPIRNDYIKVRPDEALCGLQQLHPSLQ